MRRPPPKSSCKLLQSPAPAPTTNATNAPPTANVPIGVSLSTHIPLDGNLIPENSIIPQAVEAKTPAAATTATTTASSTIALIQSLYAELETLEAQIAALLAAAPSTSAGSGTPATSTCAPLTLTDPLSLGSKGAEVSALQRFLVAQGYLNVPPTGYFGSVTEQAVEAFQSVEGIVSSGTPQTTGYGAVGPKTKAEIAALTSACEAAPSPSSMNTAASSTTATTTTPGLVTPVSPGYGGGGGEEGGGGGGGSALTRQRLSHCARERRRPYQEQ